MGTLFYEKKRITMIPDDLLRTLASCEAAYADASRNGYAKSSDVIAAVAVLKSAYLALAATNNNLKTTKSLFGMAVATLRAHRACRATREACINFHAAIEQAWAENRLHNRCSMVLSRPA
jgi:hypothetical protein